MTISSSAIQIRSYQSGDDKRISQLFREVYGDSYVYPDIYLPRLIDGYQVTGQWYSALAFHQGRLIGHASLVKDTVQQHYAELALIAVDPNFQGYGVAKSLGGHLCHYAKEQNYNLLTIKQVCSHPKSQYIARNLGFYSTALMLDYVDSPFGLPEPESIVQGILPLKSLPLPKLNWPQSWQNWIGQISQHVGESAPNEQQICRRSSASAPFIIKKTGRRLDITLYDISADFLSEVIDFPTGQLIYLKLPACEASLEWCSPLKQGGFRFAGLCPDSNDGWFLLWLRGYQLAPYEFHDTGTQYLYQMELGVN
ncbi:GNAT family N-acetyltransferase [Xenorhabdus mauleonii]|uniref:Acetyltransferase (GNAT) domain-containing protein n=1 Tax=Xenorhabdus mauleonii TaxID=351675 RepID=A0A1I3PPL9_9GAMM|nr:GNAT family N-acetyltransferase [Xenorhabdus mauleonii]PHM44734.1 GNAT family N-acetyltransferase [Xenorhabdus mauleonii]SFJ23280.1 Acetyltransferase (GNAT) domain-containing protein [Xenorhabdus mauleonii]